MDRGQDMEEGRQDWASPSGRATVEGSPFSVVLVWRQVRGVCGLRIPGRPGRGGTRLWAAGRVSEPGHQGRKTLWQNLPCSGLPPAGPVPRAASGSLPCLSIASLTRPGPLPGEARRGPQGSGGGWEPGVTGAGLPRGTGRPDEGPAPRDALGRETAEPHTRALAHTSHTHGHTHPRTLVCAATGSHAHLHAHLYHTRTLTCTPTHATCLHTHSTLTRNHTLAHPPAHAPYAEPRAPWTQPAPSLGQLPGQSSRAAPRRPRKPGETPPVSPTCSVGIPVRPPPQLG